MPFIKKLQSDYSYQPSDWPWVWGVQEVIKLLPLDDDDDLCSSVSSENTTAASADQDQEIHAATDEPEVRANDDDVPSETTIDLMEIVPQHLYMTTTPQTQTCTTNTDTAALEEAIISGRNHGTTESSSIQFTHWLHVSNEASPQIHGDDSERRRKMIQYLPVSIPPDDDRRSLSELLEEEWPRIHKFLKQLSSSGGACLISWGCSSKEEEHPPSGSGQKPLKQFCQLMVTAWFMIHQELNLLSTVHHVGKLFQQGHRHYDNFLGGWQDDDDNDGDHDRMMMMIEALVALARIHHQLGVPPECHELLLLEKNHPPDESMRDMPTNDGDDCDCCCEEEGNNDPSTIMICISHDNFNSRRRKNPIHLIHHATSTEHHPLLFGLDASVDEMAREWFGSSSSQDCHLLAQ